MSHTPTPWIAATAPTDEGVDYFQLCTADGRVIADTFNSEIAEIHTEYDEGRYEWDEQGRQDMEFVARVVNCHAELLAACERALRQFESAVDPIFSGDVDAINQLRAAIAKAKGEQ